MNYNSLIVKHLIALITIKLGSSIIASYIKVDSLNSLLIGLILYSSWVMYGLFK